MLFFVFTILFYLQPAVVDEKGQELFGECSGYLCIKAAWPGMMRTLQGDHDRYETTYFAPFKGFYFSGDGCRRSVVRLATLDIDLGYFYIML